MKFDVYCGDDQLRFTHGRWGKNNLFVIGLNPSTADSEKSDQTISKVRGFAERRNFDGFVMLNLCALRSTSPANLPKSKDEQGLVNSTSRNEQMIQKILSKVRSIRIWAAWGHNIAKRPYLFGCLREIQKITAKRSAVWERCGEPTIGGHPRHPSRLGYETEFAAFEIEKYLEDHP